METSIVYVGNIRKMNQDTESSFKTSFNKMVNQISQFVQSVSSEYIQDSNTPNTYGVIRDFVTPTNSKDSFVTVPVYEQSGKYYGVVRVYGFSTVDSI